MNAQEFRVLFDANYPHVYAYARRRTRTESDAHDVVAETFTVAWRRVDELPPSDRWLPWLYGVARRVVANQRRGAARRQRLFERLTRERMDDGATAGTAPAAERLRSEMARMRPSDQELLRLAAWEELTHDEIALVLGISVNAVGIRLHRARRRLGRRMGERYGERPDTN